MIDFIVNIAFTAFYLRFAWLHTVQLWGGDLHCIPFVVQETLLAACFLTRYPSLKTSHNIVDWLVAGIGTFAPLFLIGGVAPYALGVPLQMVGLTGSITALAYLGRGFGIVPALRRFAPAGPYRYVRHPMYAAHFITLTGFWLTYPSWTNAQIIVAAMLANVARMHAEELHLRDATAGAYSLYAELVPYRLIPGVL